MKSEKIKWNVVWAVFIIVTFIIAMCIVVLVSREQSMEERNLYTEQCVRLNTTHERDKSTASNYCFKIREDNVIQYYKLKKVNEEYFLKEVER